MNKTYTFLFLALSILLRSHTPSIIYKENKGQWPEKVLFGTEILNTKFYVNKSGFNYCVYNYHDLIKAFEIHHAKPGTNSIIRGHNYEVNFKGADFTHFQKKDPVPEYFNYFIGNKKESWASNISAYCNVEFTDVYEGINLSLYSNSSNLKYDLIVDPGADADKIQLEYVNTEKITLEKGDLVVKTSIGDIIEKAPYAYQMINGREVKILCEYKFLDSNTIGFSFPNGYDKKHRLIIDPTVIVCSYSNFVKMGCNSACTYDTNGNIYDAGYCSSSYPVTSGAFSINYQGYFDVTVSKYNSTGTSKIFSTYIGGDSLDFVLSFNTRNNEITLVGGTVSSDFPTTPGALSSAFNGGNSDLFVAKLNSSGTALIASTYLGGANNEGWYVNGPALSQMDGLTNTEMVSDKSKNVYIHSVTTSTNFPTSPGAFAVTKSGVIDACVVKLDSTLKLVWSTYLGGNRDETSKGIREDGSGGVFVLGTTTSTTFPTTSGVISSAKSGALLLSDMYLSHINSTGTGLIASTYLGTATSDYGGMIETDQNDIYICGHVSAASSFTSTAGLYSNPNGRNTIYKINRNLTAIIYQTKFGNASQNLTGVYPYLDYSAFKVDSCKNIYIAGFAQNYLPTTANAFMPFQGGIEDLYMAVFSKDCASLKFASFWGGPKYHISYGEHSDFGINSFDDKGRLYQALCSNGGLPTTPGAFVSTFTSSGDTIYNDAFVKVDLGTFINAASYGANVTGCPPFTPTFVSTTNTGTSYWDLGNGVTSTLDTISTTYTNLGNYDVLLVVTDTNTCNRVDSIKSILNVVSPTDFDLGEDIPSCANTKALIISNVTAVTYSWSTGQTTQNIFAFPGSYTLTINNGGCNTSDSVHVVVAEKKLSERFPNVVTANGDGVNDFIELKKYDFQEVELIIYDRWGREVFKTNDPVSEWHPDDLKVGTYFYVASYLSSCIGKYATDKGFISIFK